MGNEHLPEICISRGEAPGLAVLEPRQPGINRSIEKRAQ